MKIYGIIPVSPFAHAKTRLSPTLSPSERKNLLKVMLKDVTKSLKENVDEVIVISADKEVLHFADELKVQTLKEKGQTDLNGALEQAVEWCESKCDKVIIVPSDVPLIGKANIKGLIQDAEKYDIIIAPAKGGGTNALLFPPRTIKLRFGDCSFFEHIKEAKRLKLSIKIHDSFYLSLDVNTAEDLGEIILHGKNTYTRSYLEDLKLKVKPSRGAERLRIEKESKG
ncbi:2-phospho-L-lactate guanylyltransferase [Methanothermobacter tenebrarum]|uniref:2-phospho-L-lactate guanylyltransferase n=1 Tax=Methanothermobacter tenebrarum TaxID=680118 RepID=A0A328PBX3_9EURY|nr:2-phospho-L-lactate guanylyltransferase [Methanothermobacter tenebrarum]MBC7118565.1 2-phospho-L-lactate guanylyltransferase [Methanobacteriaceae archaeon]NPV64790.1 2-phospho-L-lactate guanylyltransferase [Methanobacteriaceae archaeon]RAO78631.1 2-phospho-L-lactate guanylyltransferase [Methanothermobacter tenebrarum]